MTACIVVLALTPAQTPTPNAVELDGVRGHVHLSNEVHMLGDFTVALWAKMPVLNLPANLAGWVSRTTYGIKLLDVSTLETNSGGPPQSYTLPGSGFTANTWHHIAIVRAGSMMTVYLDGAPSATVNSSSSSWAFDQFGRYDASIGPAAGSFAGRIDGIAQWEEALPAAAIAALAGVPLRDEVDLRMPIGNYTQVMSLRHWWKMGDGVEAGAGYMIADMVGGVHGYLVDAPPTAAYVID